jgi:hypothetical protein
MCFDTSCIQVYLEHLDLADLHDTPGTRELPLNIGENQRLFESTSRKEQLTFQSVVVLKYTRNLCFSTGSK